MGMGKNYGYKNLTYSKLSKFHFAYCYLFIFTCTEQIGDNLFIYVQSPTKFYNKLLKFNQRFTLFIVGSPF